MVFEPHVGGHIIDRGADGSECRWARVLALSHRIGSASAGTSTCAGSSRPTRRRPAKSRSPSPPTDPDAPGWYSPAATWTGTATDGRACATRSAQAGASPTSPKSPHNADTRRRQLPDPAGCRHTTGPCAPCHLKGPQMNRVLATDLQHVAGVPLPAITDEVMHERLQAARPYTVVLLHATGQLSGPTSTPSSGNMAGATSPCASTACSPSCCRPPTTMTSQASTFSTHRQMTFARSWTTTPEWPPASSPTKSIRSADSPAPAFLVEPASRGLPRSRRLRRN